MKLKIVIMLSIVLLTACSKNGTAPVTPNDLAGPIPRPTTGYGTDGTYEVAEMDFANPLYVSNPATIFYPKGIDGPRPVIFYSHPYGGEDKNYQRGLFEYVARKGYVLVFVPYPTLGTDVDGRYNTLWAGFRQAVSNFSGIIDTTRVGFMGHSFGGGASIALSYRAFVNYGWGNNGRFLFTMAPWYAYHITDEQLQNFPADTKMISQVYDEDDVNDHRMAIDIFKHIAIPASEKDFIYVRSSTVNGYRYVTDHVMPNTRNAYDALDYYAVYRLLDALMDYTFNGNPAGKEVALGNGAAAQVAMPGGMAPLEVTDDPQPKYAQEKYEFMCGNPDNPRIANCN